jgi:hypothetical protein
MPVFCQNIKGNSENLHLYAVSNGWIRFATGILCHTGFACVEFLRFLSSTAGELMEMRKVFYGKTSVYKMSDASINTSVVFRKKTREVLSAD